METVRHDLQFAFRLLWKDRAFSVTALLTLAICLAANVAIFSVVRAVLLRPLPFPDAERLVLAYEAFPGAGVARAGTSIPNYFDREAYTDTFESQALYRPRGVDVGEAGRPERVGAFEVTPSFFRVLRTGAAHGRVFFFLVRSWSVTSARASIKSGWQLSAGMTSNLRIPDFAACSRRAISSTLSGLTLSR